MPKAKAERYPGKLNEPLEPLPEVLPESSELPSENDESKEVAPAEVNYPIDSNAQYEFEQFIFEKQWRPEYDERFDLLCDHFFIGRDDPDKWRKLALALAKAHVPGFREKGAKTRGRPKAPLSAEEFALWQQLRELVEGGQSERNAAAITAKKLNASRSGSNVTPAALLRRLQRFEEKLRASGYFAIFNPERG